MVVGGADDGHAFVLVQPSEDFEDALPGCKVEVARRLVAQEHARLVGESPGDRHALLLAAGHLDGPVEPPVFQADEVEQFHAALSGLVGHNAAEDHGSGHVFEGGHVLDEVVGLEDVPDFVAAEIRELLGCELGDVDLVDEDAAGGRAVEGADHVEESGFAGAGWAHHGDELAGVNLDVDAAERLGFDPFLDVDFFHADSPDDDPALPVCRLFRSCGGCGVHRLTPVKFRMFCTLS